MGKQEFKQVILYSNHYLKGGYRFGDIFQIFPVDVEKLSKVYALHYPLVLEYAYDPRSYPYNGGMEFWYQDIWEKDRYKTMIKKSLRPIPKNDEWMKTHVRSTTMMRPLNIQLEIIYLLNFFLNCRIFFYTEDQCWFESRWPRDEMIDPDLKKESGEDCFWGYAGYQFHKKPCTGFTEITHFQECNVPFNKYYYKWNVIRSDKEESRLLELPKTLDASFHFYFLLDKKKRKAFYRAVKYFYQAEMMKNVTDGMKLLSLITAIETLAEIDYPQKKSSKCSKCDRPIESLTERFKKFMKIYRWHFTDYSGGLREDKSNAEEIYDEFVKSLYDLRSKIAHGDLLRQDMESFGFFVSEKDYEPDIRMITRHVHGVLLRWFWSQVEKVQGKQ